MPTHRNTSTLRVHHLFYDALSSEFKPPSDPEERLHTLGRLAYATARKGNEDVGGFNLYKRSFRYVPSWAASCEVTAKYTRKFNETLLTLEDLELAGSENNSLRIEALPVGDNPDDPEFRFTITDVACNSETYDLELGCKLTVARTALAGVAQEFFNTIG